MQELVISIRIPKDAADLVHGAFKQEFAAAAKLTAETLYDVTVDELQSRGHKAQGDLEASLYSTVSIEDFEAGTLAALKTHDIAAAVLEYGAKPAGGLVDVDAIERWLEAKHIQPKYGTQRDYAYAIARKIGREGQSPGSRFTSPGRPFNNAQRKAKRRVEKIWYDAIDHAVGRMTRGG